MKRMLIATLLLCGGAVAHTAPALAEGNEAACTEEPASKWISETPRRLPQPAPASTFATSRSRTAVMSYTRSTRTASGFRW